MKFSSREREFYVYGPIGDDDDGLYGAATVAEGLAAMPGSGDITIRINSGGGSVFELWTMIELFKGKKAKSGCKITCIVDGLAASAASILLLIGDVRIGSKASVVMIHRARTFVYGNEGELREAADLMNTVDMSLEDFYRYRLGVSLEQVETWLDSGDVYFDSDEALKWGFIHQIGSASEASYADDDWGKSHAKKMAVLSVFDCQAKVKSLEEAKAKRRSNARAYSSGHRVSIFPEKFKRAYPKNYQEWFSNVLPANDQHRVIRTMEHDLPSRIADIDYWEAKLNHSDHVIRNMSRAMLAKYR